MPRDRKALILRVIDESKLPGAQLARDAGLTPDALWSWTTGRRTPTAASLSKLAAGLRSRIRVLATLADELDRAAED